MQKILKYIMKRCSQIVFIVLNNIVLSIRTKIDNYFIIQIHTDIC